MKKSATEVMQEIVFAAVIDAIMALRAASKGVPNSLLRDLNAVHANTTPADLPAELRAAVSASVRAAFARLLKEGYSVAPVGTAPPRPSPAGEQRPQRRPPPRADDGPRRPRGGRPHGKPRPR